MARKKGSFKLKIGDKVSLPNVRTKEGVVVRIVNTLPTSMKNSELPVFEVHWVPKRVIGKRPLPARGDRGIYEKTDLIKVTPQMVLDEKEEQDS